jgi:hypothetical protein
VLMVRCRALGRRPDRDRRALVPPDADEERRLDGRHSYAQVEEYP